MLTFNYERVRVLDWHDGDTFYPLVDLGFGLTWGGPGFDGRQTLKCRLAHMNAPELGSPAGDVALAYARSLAPPGSVMPVTSLGWDNYGGRFDGVLHLPGDADFADTMIRAGQAVPVR